jgi:hypothetical protein
LPSQIISGDPAGLPVLQRDRTDNFRRRVAKLAKDASSTRLNTPSVTDAYEAPGGLLIRLVALFTQEEMVAEDIWTSRSTLKISTYDSLMSLLH